MATPEYFVNTGSSGGNGTTRNLRIFDGIDTLAVSNTRYRVLVPEIVN